ncbi:hypothetical protein G7054_g10415 [Neopestalotiopsis clavispora]|nr:hypothetical protein G7054_g10415 [Neopestalotiopsis clavispora]
MAEHNANADTTTPTRPANVGTDANEETEDTMDDHKVDVESILSSILKGLAESESGEGDHEWIVKAKDAGQGLEMKDDCDRTLLHVVARHGLFEAARELIKTEEFSIDAQDEEERTPLFAACHAEHRDIVKLLLENEADTTITDDYNQTPLYVAAEKGNQPIIELLLNTSQETLNSKSKSYEWTPLHVAVRKGHNEIVVYLRARGARLYLQDEDGWTPLWTAVYWEEARAIEVLLQKRSDDEDLQLETEGEGRTPLMEAVGRGFWKGARLLVEAGAKCDRPESTDTMRQDTALHLAVSANQSEIVGLLLKSGANVNARNKEGQHCSHLASLQGNEGLLELILDTEDSNGLNARDDHDMTPLQLASKTNKSDNDENDDDESEDDKQETTEVAAIDQSDDHASVSEPGRYNQVVRLLLKRNADIMVVSKDKKTALELAFESHLHERWETFLNFLDETSTAFSNALLRASSDKKTHKIAISLFKRQLEGQLKQSGTSIPNDAENWTVMEWAAYTENSKALWLLIASSPREEATEDALRRTRALTKARDQLAKSAVRPGDQKHGEVGDMKNSDKQKPKNTRGLENVKKVEKSADKVKLIQDYLNDPLIGLICSDDKEYSTPTPTGRFFPTPETSKAAIIQFRKQEGRFGRFKKFRPVEETIYTEGPEIIMKDVVSILESLVELSSSATTFIGAKPQFTWIHLPATNMNWVDDLLQRIMKDQEKSASDFNQAKSFFKNSWIQVPDKSSPSRIMRPRFVWRDTNGNEAQSEDPSKKGPLLQNPDDSQNNNWTLSRAVATPSPVATAIYMPYLQYSFQVSDEYYNANKMERAEKLPKLQEELDTSSTKVIEPTLRKSRNTMRETDVLGGGELKFADDLTEKRRNYDAMLKAYEKAIVHGSSTLDESYYHFGDDSKSQEDKEIRNKTQVVTDSWRDKCRESWPEKQEHGLYWPLIRVNQLWVWTIDDEWVISASSHPIDDGENELVNGILDLLEKQGDAGGSGLQPSSASEMSQFIVDYCVESYEREPKEIQKTRPEDCRLENLLSIRQTFSKSINSIVCQTFPERKARGLILLQARDETNLFERFSILTKELRERSPHMTEITDSEGRSLDEQLQQATLDAEKLSGRVKDILDELNSLESTVNYQQDVQRSMKAMKALRSMKKQAMQMGMKEMKKENAPETDLSATYIIKDINRLDSVAKRVHEAVNTTLSLQQSEIANLQARFSLEQAKFSIQQAENSAKQGRVLMVFTVVTIVFLPLSFLTSFFALDVSSFQVPAWVIGVIFSVSIAFVVPTVILAFIPPQSILKFTVNLPGSIAEETSESVRSMRNFVADAKKNANW